MSKIIILSMGNGRRLFIIPSSGLYFIADEYDVVRMPNGTTIINPLGVLLEKLQIAGFEVETIK